MVGVGVQKLVKLAENYLRKNSKTKTSTKMPLISTTLPQLIKYSRKEKKLNVGGKELIESDCRSKYSEKIIAPSKNLSSILNLISLN